MNLFLKIISVFISILVILNISSFDVSFGLVYFYIMGGVFVLLLSLNPTLKVNNYIIWLVVAAMCSIVFNNIPSFFNPYERFIAFLLVISLISPLFRAPLLESFRKKLFNVLNILIIVLSVGSIVGLLSGVYKGKEGRFDFTGFFTHSMVLGPMAGIAIISSIYYLYTTKQKSLYFVIAALSFLACLASGSRSALVAAAGGVLFFFFKINQGKLTRFMLSLFVVGGILILSFPLWENQTESLMVKMNLAESQGSLAGTRENLWAARIIEFKSSPVMGIGFASVNPEETLRFDEDSGRIEPGSSWLAILSMTGLFGFIPIIILILKYSVFIFKDKVDSIQKAYYGALLSLFILHMFAEGYVFSAGSGMFFYFWLLLGIIDMHKRSIENQSLTIFKNKKLI